MTTDIFDALLSDAEPDTAALAASLRRKEGMGTLAAMTGIKGLQKLGPDMVEQAGKGAQDFATLRDRNQNLALSRAIAMQNHRDSLDLADSNAADRRDNNEANRALRRELAEGRQTPVTPVTIKDPENPNNTIIIDGRTGKKLGDGPSFTAAGKLEAGRSFAMAGMGRAIGEARNLLSGLATGSKPTHSGVGSWVDKGLNMVGVTTGSANAANQLKVIGGAMTSKVPRMQGPQSDKDTLLYRQMAGQVGDDTLPVEQRLAALDTVEAMWAHYDPEGRDAEDNPAGAKPGSKLPQATANTRFQGVDPGQSHIEQVGRGTPQPGDNPHETPATRAAIPEQGPAYNPADNQPAVEAGWNAAKEARLAELKAKHNRG